MVYTTSLTGKSQEKQEHSFCFRVPIIKAIAPTYLSKHYVIKDDALSLSGRGGILIKGRFEVIDTDVAGLAHLIELMTPDMALCTGIPESDKGSITTKANLDGKGYKDAITRTTENFPFRKEPSLLFLDYDAPKDGTPAPINSREEFRAAIISAMPELKDAPMLIRDSASSHIYRVADGECLKGQGGLRLYVLIDDGTATKHVFDRLNLSLWRNGLGRIEIGKAGQMMPKTIIDMSLCRAANLDFAAGAKCGAGLEQRLPPIEFFNEHNAPANTSQIKPLTAEEKREIVAMENKAKASVCDLAAAVKAAVITERITQDQGSESTVRAAITCGHLPLSWRLITSRSESVTVEQVMKGGARFNKKSCADPIEPDYNGGSLTVAHINVTDKGEVWIYSHAHGGQEYTLEDLPAVAEGKRFRFEHAKRWAWVTLREQISALIWGRIVANGYEQSGRKALNSAILQLLREGCRNPLEVWHLVNSLPDTHAAKVYLAERMQAGSEALDYTLCNAYLNALDVIAPLGSFENPTAEQVIGVDDDTAKRPAFMTKLLEENKNKTGVQA
jgi:hypothetical protein